MSLVWALGPMEVRFGGKAGSFSREFEHPKLYMQGESYYGEWQGASNNLSINISRNLVESALHRQLTSDAADRIAGRSREIEYLLSILRKDVAAKEPAGPMFSEAVMTCIVGQLWPDDDHRKRIEERSGGTTIMRACDEIEARLSERLSLADLAKTAGYSTRHFCRAFRSALGCPPHEYIVRRRVERARTLIGEGNLKLIDVAEAVGFSSQSHMNAAFRKVFGTTPSTFK